MAARSRPLGCGHRDQDPCRADRTIEQTPPAYRFGATALAPLRTIKQAEGGFDAHAEAVEGRREHSASVSREEPLEARLDESAAVADGSPHRKAWIRRLGTPVASGAGGEKWRVMADPFDTIGLSFIAAICCEEFSLIIQDWVGDKPKRVALAE